MEQEERRKKQRAEAQKKLELAKQEQEARDAVVYDKDNSIEMALIKCIDSTLMVKLEDFAAENEIEIKLKEEEKSAQEAEIRYDLDISLDEFYWGEECLI